LCYYERFNLAPAPIMGMESLHNYIADKMVGEKISATKLPLVLCKNLRNIKQCKLFWPQVTLCHVPV